MLQVVKSTFIGKLVLKYIKKNFTRQLGGEPHPGQPAGWPGCGSPPNCPTAPQLVRIERRKWGTLECRSTLGGGDSEHRPA